MGAINSDGLEFLGDLGRRIKQQFGRHPGHFRPHNHRGRILGRSSLFAFSFCF